MALLWLVGLGLWVEVQGPPLSLRDVLLWLSLAMLVASVGNPLGWAKSMLLDWCPLYVLLVGYDIAHGLVDNLGIREHVDPHLSFDQAIFGGQGPTDLLQDWLWTGTATWYDDVFFALYLSHFVVTLAVCAILWIRAREGFLAFRRRVVGTWLVALVFFAAYPSVPPWMAAEQGHLPEMTRIVASLMGVASDQASAILGEGDGRISLANPVAAVPSMHAALPMVLLLFLWHRATWLRVLLAAYTLAMAFVLVYGGEHYLFDILAGWACAAAV
ncbi:MAG: phosphatase PAP2 family protein, partial [Actinomycetes bacterium]